MESRLRRFEAPAAATGVICLARVVLADDVTTSPKDTLPGRHTIFAGRLDVGLVALVAGLGVGASRSFILDLGVALLDANVFESDLLYALNTRLVGLVWGVLDALTAVVVGVPQVEFSGNPEKSREVIPPGLRLNVRRLDVALEVALNRHIQTS